MQIAVTSQNRRSISSHAGRCRVFWIFSIEDDRIVDKQLLETAKEQSFHETSAHAPHPIDHVDVLITGGMNHELVSRLEKKGIKSIVTSEQDPDNAVSMYLKGSLENEMVLKHHHHS